MVIELAGGTHIATIVTRQSVAAMALEPGTPVTALFKASSVILGAMA